MNQPYKPAGYNSVSPYFVINGAEKFSNLLKQLFNAAELRRYGRPDGTIMHLELKLDDSVLMIGDSSEEYPPNTHLIHVYVPDADAVYKKAVELGCEPMKEPKQQEGDPDKRGMFKDFAGNMWAVGTQQ